MEWRRFGELPPPLLYRILRFRQAVFVVEQNCAYPDLDGLDMPACHLLLRVESDLAGYLRLVPPAEPGACVRIGRVAVAPARRRRGLARLMMAEALRLAAEAYPGYGTLVSAQAYLAPFYAGLGFLPVCEPYDDFAVPHIDMRRPP
ncbi:MAG TPA: GNAT family N-acetyltransferase [Stellaceae bacterium]|nr:GNAT family N-acetyltransferase [Stellaceae bacterium]